MITILGDPETSAVAEIENFYDMQTALQDTVGAYRNITTGEGASLHMRKTTGAAVLLYFYGTSVTVTSPKLFLLENATANAIYYYGTCTLSLESGQVNYWKTASNGGGMEDRPTYEQRHHHCLGP